MVALEKQLNLYNEEENDDESDYLLSTCYVPHTVLSPLRGLTHLMFLTILIRKEELSLVPFSRLKGCGRESWK